MGMKQKMVKPKKMTASLPKLARKSFTRSTSYDAGKNISEFTNWVVSSVNADEETTSTLPKMRQRSRDLYKNNSIARAIINTMVTNVIGTGFRPQLSTYRLGHTDDVDANLNTQLKLLEQHFLRYMQYDFGFGDLNSLTRQAYLNSLMSGDTLVLFERRSEHILGYLVEADNVAGGSATSGTTSVEGVVITPAGMHIGYNIRSRYGDVNKTIRKINKNNKLNAILLYNKDRIGQTRGIPFVAPAMVGIKVIDSYNRSERKGALVSSLFVGFIKNSEARSPIDTGNDNDYALNSGAMYRLDGDEEVTFANPNRPNSNYDSFVSSNFKQLCASLGLPAEIVLKYFSSSYSASRGAKIEAIKLFKNERKFIYDNLLTPFFFAWMDFYKEKGQLDFITDYNLLKSVLKIGWIGDSFGQLDDLKEVNASIKRINNGLSTVEEETLSLTGGDYDYNVKKLGKETAELTSSNVPAYKENTDVTT